MAILKLKNNQGKWTSVPAFQGEPGKDGAVQYTAGKGITIENDTISAEVDKQYVDEAIANAGTGAETGFVLNGSPVFKISCSYIHQLEVGKTYSGYINANDAIAMYKYCVENGVEYPAINLLMNSSNAEFTGIGVARTKVVNITGSSAMIDIYGLSASNPNKYWYIDLRISCSADGNYTMSTSTSIKFSEYVGATKTYVGNAIKTSITSTLESDY